MCVCFPFLSRIVYMWPSTKCFEHDSITQQLRHWNYLFLAARREHAIPCGAKCYHTNLSEFWFLKGSRSPNFSPFHGLPRSPCFPSPYPVVQALFTHMLKEQLISGLKTKGRFSFQRQKSPMKFRLAAPGIWILKRSM
jgi:hypothetical protein